MYSDGQQQYGIKPLTTDFTSGLYVRAYNTLFSGKGKVFKDEGNALDRPNFPKGYALYAFDLTPDMREDDHFNLAKQGSVRLVLKFRESLGRKRDRHCLRTVPECDRDRQESQRDLRLCGMNTCELERVIGDYVKRFDGVFASDRQDCWCVIPIHPKCPVNIGSPSTSTTMDIMENTLTRSDAHPVDYLNIT